MGYMFVPAGEYVFHYGEKGDQFYTILQGQCQVLIPVVNKRLSRMQSSFVNSCLKKQVTLKTLMEQANIQSSEPSRQHTKRRSSKIN